MRSELSPRWLRIHSLPTSKRYPENDLEYQVVMSRHNKVATHVLGNSKTCLLFCPDLLDPASLASNSERYAALQLRAVDGLVFEEPDDPESRVGFFGAEVTWRWGDFDFLLRDIADERLRALFFSPASGFVFAPYDGGADIIAPTAEHLPALRRKWRGWLAPHANDL